MTCLSKYFKILFQCNQKTAEMEGRKRNRKQGFDYTQDAIYFITICTKDRLLHFGEIVQGKMIESAAGSIVADQIRWLE